LVIKSFTDGPSSNQMETPTRRGAVKSPTPDRVMYNQIEDE
jgi:hypothetical protein